MTESLEALKRLIDECTDEDRQALARYLNMFVLRHPLEDEWGVASDTILSAIRRSSDLTKRGVRGIIAEAVFESDVLPTIAPLGWNAGAIPPGDWPYDALLEKAGRSVRVQIKLQRLEAGVPKRYFPKHYPEELFVVEVQKTRTGKKRSGVAGATEEKALATRPYRFGDFDILAVNMHPATRQWASFRYTVGDWLLPRPSENSLIEVFQPVSLETNNTWTDDLATCLSWFLSGEKKRVLDLRHTPHPAQCAAGFRCNGSLRGKNSKFPLSAA
jgi:hypothetical protein